MAERILLDTGVLVALINKRDRDHRRCVDAWSPRRATVLSVEGVLVEAAHMLRRVPSGLDRAVQLVAAAKVHFVPSTPEVLNRACTLIERYDDVPMDLVDALLLCAADDHDVREIFTLDRRGFSAYRTKKGRALTIAPG